MNLKLPDLFIERLKTIISPELFDSVLESFVQPSSRCFRINRLKSSGQDVIQYLEDQNIDFSFVPLMKDVLIVSNAFEQDLRNCALIQDGRLYQQSLSSMLPVLILDPQPGENILDMCAAPGSKTSQIAAMMQNEGQLVAVEVVRGRYYKLRSVCQLLGVNNVSFKLMDARRFRSADLFDRILVDAPCSVEGRFKVNDPKSYAFWSPRKIKEMAHKQRGLLLASTRLLKPGGTLVYSTCTFAPEENEGVVDWLLKKSGKSVQVAPLSLKDNNVPFSPGLTNWQGKFFNDQIQNCRRIIPQNNFEGFFITQLQKIA